MSCVGGGQARPSHLWQSVGRIRRRSLPHLGTRPLAAYGDGAMGHSAWSRVHAEFTITGKDGPFAPKPIRCRPGTVVGMAGGVW